MVTYNIICCTYH